MRQAVADEIRRPARRLQRQLLRLRAARAEGGYPRCGRRQRAAAGAPHEAQHARLLTLALRHRRYPRCRRRRLPHRLPRTVPGVHGGGQLGEALQGSDMVIMPAGVLRKPGMTRDDLFNINAGIVKDLIPAIAKYCPNALVNMISILVNSAVPIAAEIFKKAGT